MDPLTARTLFLLVPAPLWPPLTFFLAVSDQIGGAIVAGTFSLINTVLLAVLTVRLAQRRKRDKDEGPDDRPDS